MPNTRRRRFSVQNDIGGRDSSKMQKGMKTSAHQVLEDTKNAVNNLVSMNNSRSKNKISPNSSKNSNSLEIVAECDSLITVITARNTLDKDVTASSSNIDLFNILTADNSSVEQSIEGLSPRRSQGKEREARQLNRDRTPVKRDKHPRQHRVKVRSPKRRLPMMDQKGTENIRNTIGTAAVNWEQEVEVTVEAAANDLTAEVIIEDQQQEQRIRNIEEQQQQRIRVIEEHQQEQRISNHSLDDMCRICHGGETLSNELGQLISACSCRGTVGRVHVKCLERWLTESGKSRCELCGTRYATRRVHRYGVPRALIMWVLSQNAKQLMVDSLGIMLMSPLAVLAAWLSGRTLAGLMTQDSHNTPWPLASTFVLACMTLVCYYCWIVSAATRHALGWWIWYRSQYEVRLQFQEIEE